MGVMRFDEIVFADDFFRSAANALQSHPSNRRFLHRALSIPAARLGIRCREIAALSDGGDLDVAAMMSELSLPRDSQGWQKQDKRIFDTWPGPTCSQASIKPRS